tara:strand:- start:15557 stop:15721 length:165 start_codon:yes stop_codon:yes gene_type:complete
VGNIKDHYHSFLENGGSNLGFSMEFLPELDDVNDILVNQIDAHMYAELKSINDE